MVFFQVSGIFGKDVDDFRDVPGAKPGRTGVVGEAFRGRQPGDGREFVFFHVFAELVENVAFRNLDAVLLALSLEVQVFEGVIMRVAGVGDEGGFVEYFLFRRKLADAGAAALDDGRA